MNGDSFNEIDRIRSEFAKKIEDGKRVRAFMSTPEWQWFSDQIQTTIDYHRERILTNKIPSERDELYLKGFTQGLADVINTARSFEQAGSKARQEARKFEEGMES